MKTKTWKFAFRKLIWSYSPEFKTKKEALNWYNSLNENIMSKLRKSSAKIVDFSTYQGKKKTRVF